MQIQRTAILLEIIDPDTPDPLGRSGITEIRDIDIRAIENENNRERKNGEQEKSDNASPESISSRRTDLDHQSFQPALPSFQSFSSF